MTLIIMIMKDDEGKKSMGREKYQLARNKTKEVETKLRKCNNKGKMDDEG